MMLSYGSNEFSLRMYIVTVLKYLLDKVWVPSWSCWWCYEPETPSWRLHLFTYSNPTHNFNLLCGVFMCGRKVQKLMKKNSGGKGKGCGVWEQEHEIVSKSYRHHLVIRRVGAVEEQRTPFQIGICSLRCGCSFSFLFFSTPFLSFPSEDFFAIKWADQPEIDLSRKKIRNLV